MVMLAGMQCGRGPEHAFDERQAADLVQDLRQLRLHPGALPGGQDDDVYVTHARGIQTLILVWVARADSIWLFNQFIAFDDVVDLLGGQAEALSDLPGDVSFGRAELPRFCYLTK